MVIEGLDSKVHFVFLTKAILKKGSKLNNRRKVRQRRRKKSRAKNVEETASFKKENHYKDVVVLQSKA